MLKTLAENNAAARASRFYSPGKEAPRLNGVACPECGAELFDTEPSIVLLSYPPKKSIHCSACGYTGYRMVP